MVALGRDERGATSVIGLILLVAVTVIVAATVAVFVFGVDTKDVENAAEEILDMDEDLDANSLAPVLFAPLSGPGRGREPDEESADADENPADGVTRGRPSGR